MNADSIAVLVGGAGTIAFLAWFFFGARQGKRAKTVGDAPAEPVASEAERCDLVVVGMHCAACVGRVEKALKQVPGVQDATVNLLAERAAIRFDARQAKPADLIAAIEESGYDARIAPSGDLSERQAANESGAADASERRSEAAELNRRFSISLALTLPVLVMGMGPHLHLIPMAWSMRPWWVWAQLILTTPVLFWAGSGFFRGAWAALRQRSGDMNTLIVIGTLSAYIYSLAVTVVPGFFTARGLTAGVYYETAAVIITLILLGRLLEARAKRSTA